MFNFRTSLCSTLCSIFSLIMLVSANTIAATNDDFVTTWKTDNPGDSNDTSITITTHAGSTYSYNVDWDNDEIFDEFNITGDITHDFGTVGEHTIRISGNFPRIYFKFNEKVTEINHWGTNVWTSMDSAFWGASNVINKATDTPNLSNCTSLSFMFQSASLIGGDDDTGNWDWDTSTIEDFAHMLFRASEFNKDVSLWQTVNATSLNDMFYQASNFDQNLGGWNIESVTTLSGLSGFFTSTSLSYDNYDAILIGWAAQNVNSNLAFKTGGVKYCTQEAVDARNILINDFGWAITQDTREPSCNPTMDLDVRITNQDDTINPGDLIDYQVQVLSSGSLAVIDANFFDILPASLVASTWICNNANLGYCSASGTGQINDTLNIPTGSLAVYLVTATVTNNYFNEILYEAQATGNINQSESNLVNNYDSDLTLNGDTLFINGFEMPIILIKSVATNFEFDFSKVDNSLGFFPKPIARGVDENGRTNLWFHIRNSNGKLQIRMSNKVDEIWQPRQWQHVNKDLTTIEWGEVK